jgi:hypothetical protein
VLSCTLRHIPVSFSKVRLEFICRADRNLRTLLPPVNPTDHEPVQFVTILGLVLCLGMLYLRAKTAKARPASNAKQRVKTAQVLLIALAVWLVVSFNLQHLNRALDGQRVGEPSTWEQIVRFLAGGN